MTKRFLRNAASILLIVCSVSSQTAKAEWFRFNDFSKGINTYATKSELAPPYAMTLQNFEIQSKSLIQILGSDSLQKTRLSSSPVRALYRYYDQSTGAKRLLAVSGNLIYVKEDADTFKILGNNVGKVSVTNGSKRVKGVWGTNWDYWVGDGSGDNLTLIIAGVKYPVYRVTAYNDLALVSNFSGSTSDSVAYMLAPVVNDTTFIDFEFWREKLFIADGEHEVRSWRHDDGMQWGYWVVDSFRVDSSYIASCAGSSGLTVTMDNLAGGFDRIPIATGQFYKDSAYCVVFRDTTTEYTIRTPLTIYGVTGGTTVTTFCIQGDTGIIGGSTARHIKHDDMAYIVKPRFSSYAFSEDTLYTGVLDTLSSPISGAGLGGLTVVDAIDNSYSLRNEELRGGVYAIEWEDALDGQAYCRTVTNSGGTSNSVRIRIAYDATVTPSLTTRYTILKLNYYPRSNYVRVNNDRLWFSGIYNQPDELWYSEFIDPFEVTLINTNNPYYLSRGDKAYVTGLQSISDRLFAFKNSAIWGLSGYDEFDFQRRQVYTEFGATSPYSLTKYFNDAYLVSNQGLYQFDGQALTFHSPYVRSFFEDSLVTSLKDNVAVTVYKDKVWIGLGTSGTFNNTTLLYDFSGYTELPIYNSSSFAKFDAPGDNGDLIIGADSGRVYQYGNTDSLNGALPSPVFQTPFIAFNDPKQFKRMDKVELTYSMQTGGRIIVDIYKDFGTTPAFTDTVDVIRASHDRAKIECEVYGYAFSVKFTGVGVRRMEISEWGADVLDYGEDENYK